MYYYMYKEKGREPYFGLSFCFAKLSFKLLKISEVRD